jgi:hypothetical protein
MDGLLHEAGMPVEVERGGILVGQVFSPSDGGRHLVEVSDLIVSEHTTSTLIELRFTFESWRSLTEVMQRGFPGKRIVGWYHTHLVEVSVTSGGGQSEPTKLFFSRDDVFLHSQFFPDPWYIALVMDPQGNDLFFQWKDGEICACNGYYLF